MQLSKRIKNRAFYHTFLKYLEIKNSGFNNFSSDNTFVVFANPRGGSTWLAQLLLEIPKSVLCWEPLFKGRLKEVDRLNFFWQQPIPANAEWKDAEIVFKKLLNREILKLSIYYRNDLFRLLDAKSYIFKFCYGNMLMEWLTNKFSFNSVLLVRHPCAVVASQLQHGGWSSINLDNSGYDIPRFHFNDVYLQYKDILSTVKNIEEKLAADWCLTMASSVLSRANDVNWVTVAYENLYTNFEYEIDRIFKRWNQTIPSEIFLKHRQLSFTTKRSSEKHINEGIQITSWQKNLSEKQILISWEY